MEILKYIVLGIIQGLTEPLPVSSSGHLLIFKNLFNTNMFNDLNFEIIVNFASFMAIFFIFRKDIIKLVKGFFSYLFTKDDGTKENTEILKRTKFDFKYCLLIVIGSIPVGITGILFKDILEDKLTSIKVVGFALLITALALIIVRNIKGPKKDKDITYFDALVIGLLQAITIIPGISRSGTVLVGCLLRNLDRETALKYTFMLYFPPSIASMILGVKDIISAGNLSSILLPYTLGFIASLIVTYFAYKWLSELVKKGKLWKFSIYCIIMGLFTIIYFW